MKKSLWAFHGFWMMALVVNNSAQAQRWPVDSLKTYFMKGHKPGAVARVYHNLGLLYKTSGWKPCRSFTSDLSAGTHTGGAG